MPRKNNDDETLAPEETPVCDHCGNIMISEDGEWVCPHCQGEIDFLGGDEE